MDLTTWETCIFGHPERSGVYAVCAKENSRSAEHVLYIGSTSNLRKRISSSTHPYRIAFERFPVHVRFFECENYKQIEIEMIKKYRPIMNTQHNG